VEKCETQEPDFSALIEDSPGVTALAELEQAVKRIHWVVDKLEERLSGVLGPEEPYPQKEEEAYASMWPPYFSQISCSTESLLVEADRLEDILRRVAL
jgi:hypothetical protein